MAVRRIGSVLIDPLREFLKDSRASGIVLLLCTVVSLLLANSSWSATYLNLINFHVGDGRLPHTVLHWINDGAMALFFFLVGMEIRRELVNGELSAPAKALMPAGAALGGMLVPALIFLAFTGGTPYSSGWGIPMATDIAFSLGVASLLGNRMPIALKIFLMALAIIDDLGAIIVIALFYGGKLVWLYFLLSAAIVVVMWFGRRSALVVVLLGLILWYTVFNAGIHPTIAGVVTAMFIPLRNLKSLEHRLHDPVNFLVLPIFALANTAVVLPPDIAGAFNSPLSWGVIAGLVIGKPLGVVLFSWLLVKARLGALPTRTSWKQMLGAGMLAGIGFTMSIFITMLAFTDSSSQDIAKLAVMLASLLSMLLGLLILRLV